MEKLLEQARSAFDQAEIYSFDQRESSVSFADGKLYEIEGKLQSGLSLRVIKDGKLGLAYTRNLRDRSELLENARLSLDGGVEATFDLPLTRDLPEVEAYDPEIEEAGTARIVSELARVADHLRGLADGEIRLHGWSRVRSLRIRNTAGTDLSSTSGDFGLGGGLGIPGSAAGVMRFHHFRRFTPFPGETLDEVVALYDATRKSATPEGGRMKVLFMPGSSITLTWRILSGTSGKSVYEKISPIESRVGERIFDEKLTVYDDPRAPDHPDARPFDDEGVARDRFDLIEGGVLKGFYNNLDYAGRLGAKPTGHGHRSTMWGGDPVSLPPAPSLASLRIAPGPHSFGDLVGMMDRGVILEGTLGAHSGNIPNGDYSVGVSPGFYVERGEIVGRVTDVMVAGNAYDTLRNVVAVGDTPRPCFGGVLPPLLCDDVSVACRTG